MKKLLSIEYMRALSMLYIVGYWHLFEYTEAFPEFHNFFTYKFTKVVLGVFVILSGFLVGNSVKKSSSLANFYMKRVVRIYPLYVLAVILYDLYGIIDNASAFKLMFLLTIFFGPPPLTLWFITMIMLLYLISPLLIKLVAEPARYLMFIIALFAVILVFNAAFKTVDYRFLLYLPCFCLGIYCSQYGPITRFVNIKSALMLFCAGLPLFYLKIDSSFLNNLKGLPIILSCTYIIFLISYSMEEKFKNLKIISMVSYGSYAMYLFHRPIYITLEFIYLPENKQTQILYLMTICLVVIVVMSVMIQKLYDTVCLAVKKNNFV